MASSQSEFAGFSAERAMGGEPVEVLSTRNGKLVELVKDEEGDFVRRTYLPEAVREIEREAAAPFDEVWQGFGQMFTGAGLELVDCALIEETLDDDPIIVVRYLGELGTEASPSALPPEKKVTLAGSLGGLLTSHPDFLPDPQGFMFDAFAIDPSSGNAVMVDVDPYLKPRHKEFMGQFDTPRVEAVQGVFMRRIGLNIAEWAANDEERTAMATAFCRTAGEVLNDDSSMELINNFSYVHFMSNGMSPEQLSAMNF